jgi:hypothetical protein
MKEEKENCKRLQLVTLKVTPADQSEIITITALNTST